MRGPLVSNRFAIVALLALVGACAQIEGLSGLKFDGSGEAGASGGGSAQGGAGPTGSVGSGQSGGGANGPGGAGGTGGSPGGENCTNGIDDNGNNLVDCADPACKMDFSCVDVPAAPWRGPIIVFANASAAMSCSGAYGVAAFDGGTAPMQKNVTCNDCTCDASPCPSFQLEAYSDGNCGNPILMNNVGPIAVCSQVPATTAGSVILTSTAGSGVCGSAGGTVKNRPTPTFVDRVLGCAPAAVGKGCANGGACAPKTGMAGQTICVYQSGDINACPSGFTQRTLVYRDIADNRGCDMCTCSLPVGNCSGGLAVFSDNACMNPVHTLAPNGMCQAGFSYASLEPTYVSPCNPTGGGTPNGSLSGSMPVTVCCE
jgi:hypothetical protein